MASNSSPNTGVPPTHASTVNRFFENEGISADLPDTCSKDGATSDLIRDHLKVSHIHPGQITATLTVKPLISNIYGTLHGGAVAAVAELVSVACVQSVVDKHLFLGELSTCYLSAAVLDAELEVSGFIVRQGRNVTVTSVEFRIKESKKLVYTARATFYNVPVANL